MSHCVLLFVLLPLSCAFHVPIVRTRRPIASTIPHSLVMKIAEPPQKKAGLFGTGLGATKQSAKTAVKDGVCPHACCECCPGAAARLSGLASVTSVTSPFCAAGDEEDESKKLLQQIKDAGIAGIIS